MKYLILILIVIFTGCGEIYNTNQTPDLGFNDKVIKYIITDSEVIDNQDIWYTELPESTTIQEVIEDLERDENSCVVQDLAQDGDTKFVTFRCDMKE